MSNEKAAEDIFPPLHAGNRYTKGPPPLTPTEGFAQVSALMQPLRIEPPLTVEWFDGEKHEYPPEDGAGQMTVGYSVNDYKQDTGKPPLMEAVLIPFGKTLLALAAMMEDMKHKHKLQGAKDPFQEWRQLPGGKWRWANGGARHATTPFTINNADGNHLHILHAIWGLMASYELHLEESESTTKE